MTVQQIYVRCYGGSQIATRRYDALLTCLGIWLALTLLDLFITVLRPEIASSALTWSTLVPHLPALLALTGIWLFKTTCVLLMVVLGLDVLFEAGLRFMAALRGRPDGSDDQDAVPHVEDSPCGS
jgi:hypothetical protein